MDNRLHIFILGRETEYLQVLARFLSCLKHTNVKLVGTGKDEEFYEKLSQAKGEKVILVIDAMFDVNNVVVEWVWKRLRLNSERISRELAGVPVIVLGMERQNFLESVEGKVFRDFPGNHQYLAKPVNLYTLLKRLRRVIPVYPYSLSLINLDAPATVTASLLHDLKNLYLKFDFQGSEDQLLERYHNVEVDFKNYVQLEKDKSVILEIREELSKIKKEIHMRGNNERKKDTHN